MKELLQQLKKEEQELKSMQKQVEKNLEEAPEGGLRISHKEGRAIYYQRIPSEKYDPKNQGKYIKKSEVELAHKLAQKIMKNVC